MSLIASNLSALNAKLPPEVTLVAVSKNHPPEAIMEAYEAGQRHFGENRVQEMLHKAQQLPTDIRWHLIGHLQTNKVKQVVPLVYLIHSVDSAKLLKEISNSAIREGRVVDILLQVHIAREETKFGLDEEEVELLLEDPLCRNARGIRIRGLMGMATFTGDMDQVSGEFRRLKSLFDRISAQWFAGEGYFNELSMGMTGDFEVAIGEGSTMIRIGTLIFGNR